MKNKKRKKSLPLHKHIHRHVKLAVVPHRHNQFRPHLVRRHGIALLLVLVSGLVFGQNWLQTGSVLGGEADITVTSLLNSTNKTRSEWHEPVLRYNRELSDAAFLKARNMFDQQYWAHTAPDGTTPWHWFGEVGYNYAYAGENLAKNFSSTASAMTAWMNSPKHRENILSPHYSEVGFAVADGKLNGKKTTLIVALFGRPATDVAGATSVEETASPVGGNVSLTTRFGVILQTATPTALGSAVLLMFAAIIALFAHMYRKRLPMAVRQTWKYYHGLYKATGLMVIAVLLVALYSGGQI